MGRRGLAHTSLVTALAGVGMGMTVQILPVLARPSPGSRTAGANAVVSRPRVDGLERQEAFAAAMTVPGELASMFEPTIIHVVALPVVDGRSPVAGRPPLAPGRSPVATGPSSYVWPTAGVVTGPFGEPRGASRHPGLDIAGPTGTPVRAAAPGRVLVAGPAPAGFGGYGNLVVIDAGSGVTMLYAHLSAVSVAVGQVVKAGDRLGAVGQTGAATGPHLHYEVRRGGAAVDPAAYLPR